MKKIMLLGVFVCLSFGVFAQISVPEPSPSASFVQTLGFAKIKIDYARPSAKGREVFGKLVPYNALWRTGASDCSTINFSENVTVGGKKIEKGRYSIFSIPTADQWTIVLNTDTTLHGTTGYDEKKDVHRFTVKSEKSPRFYETFTIELSDIVKDNGTFYIIWENTMVKFDIVTNTKERILADIDAKLNKQKTENANLYYQAAEYYYNQRMELDQANAWVMKASKIEPTNFYYPNLQAKILETQGKFAEAIPVAQKAVELGKIKNYTQTVQNWEKKIATWQQIATTEPQAAKSHAGHGMKLESTLPEAKQDNSVQTSISKVLGSYYAVKNALVADDAKTANQQAGELLKALAAVPMAKMTAEQHTLFMGLSEKIKTDAQQIADAKEVKQQRERFNELSNNLFALVKGLKANDKAVYQQYCPMKKAYWLSDNAAIKNPYYGKMMLTCGKVTETLN